MRWATEHMQAWIESDGRLYVRYRDSENKGTPDLPHWELVWKTTILPIVSWDTRSQAKSPKHE